MINFYRKWRDRRRQKKATDCYFELLKSTYMAMVEKNTRPKIIFLSTPTGVNPFFCPVALDKLKAQIEKTEKEAEEEVRKLLEEKF